MDIRCSVCMYLSAEVYQCTGHASWLTWHKREFQRSTELKYGWSIQVCQRLGRGCSLDAEVRKKYFT